MSQRHDRAAPVRALLQRVTGASVRVDGEIVGQTASQTGPGLLILLCAMPGDDQPTADALALKISRLRMFRDPDGKMNLSVVQANGSALVVSQFTLAADTSRGNRPGFSRAAPPQEAEILYLQFAQALQARGVPTETGRFGAEMQVQLTNDGPVTFWLDTETS